MKNNTVDLTWFDFVRPRVSEWIDRFEHLESNRILCCGWLLPAARRKDVDSDFWIVKWFVRLVGLVTVLRVQANGMLLLSKSFSFAGHECHMHPRAVFQLRFAGSIDFFSIDKKSGGRAKRKDPMRLINKFFRVKTKNDRSHPHNSNERSSKTQNPPHHIATMALCFLPNDYICFIPDVPMSSVSAIDKWCFFTVKSTAN